jgi:LDH2 family malate/lactate/ureidoglycolate dehydrogenase
MDKMVRTIQQLVAPKAEVLRFISECMTKAGSSREDAEIVAHHLMFADYRGHFSHGMNRMQMYINDIKRKLTDPCAKPQIASDFNVRF